jgi:hypothetical protein
MASKVAYTIKEFCQAHGISESAYYQAQREGWGPKVMLIGKAGSRISEEAAAEWRRAMEERAAADRKTEVA